MVNQNQQMIAVDEALSARVQDKVEFAKIARVLPDGVDGKRLVQGFLMAVRQDAKLMQCSEVSLWQCLLDCARLGLWPGPHGHIYLVPFKSKATPITGYKGLIALMKRLGGVAKVEARLVRSNDEFRVELGDTPRLIHNPVIVGEPGDVVAAYAVATLHDGTTQFEVMRRDEITEIRDSSAGYRHDPKGHPWALHPGEMARKTVVRRLVKYVGLDETIAAAIDAEDKADKAVTLEAKRVRSAAELMRTVPPAAYIDHEPAPQTVATGTMTPEEIAEAERREREEATGEDQRWMQD